MCTSNWVLEKSVNWYIETADYDMMRDFFSVTNIIKLY